MTSPRLPQALRSLRHRDYRLYFFGQLTSMAGTWMQQTAQAWLVYRLTGSGTLLGLVAAAGQAPSLFLGLAGGAAADRWERRRVLLATQCAALLQAAALAWLTASGRVQVWHVFVLATALGLINVFDMPARQAFVSQLVPREDMANAIALSGILLNASRLVGPAAAGLIIARAGEAACFWANAASYVAMVGALLAIAPRPAPERGGSGELARIRAGLRYCFEDPERRAVLALLAAVSLVAVPVMMLLPLYSEGVLKAGPRGLGFLTTAFASGALLASGLLARRAVPDELPAQIGRAAMLFGAAVAVLSRLRAFPAACAALATAGAGMMACFAASNIRLQDRASDAMRGRVMGLFSMTFMATGPFGALLVGWASDRVGVSATFAAAGLACAAAGALFLRARRIPLPPLPGLARPAACALLLAAAGAAGAEESLLAPVPEVPPPARELTWEDCVRLALERNPDLASARKDVDAGRAAYRGSYNGVLPGLSLSNSYATGSSAAGRASYSAAATANVDLFDMGRVAGIRSASAALEQSLAALRVASADLRLSLRQAHADALAARAREEAARRVLEIRRRGAEMVALRYDSGREYKGNRMNAEAQLLQARASLAQAQRGLRSSRRALARRLGLDDFEEATAAGALEAAAPPPPPAVAALVDARPDVAAEAARMAAARASRASARGVLWPSLSASYSRTRSGATEFPADRTGWTAGATLSLPLFSGGPAAAYYDVAAANRRLEAAEQDVRAARNAAVADLESAWAAYAAAADQARVQAAQLEASRQRNDEADVRYASGLLTFDNWTLIVTQRVNDEQQAVQASRDAVVAQAAWERALGTALGE